MKVFGYGTEAADKDLVSVVFERKDPRAGEIAFKVTYCGVCHSDLHQVRNDWRNTTYPCVPGHEVVGEVTAVGDGVTRFAVGDVIGVGCMVNSCLDCEKCDAGVENYCQGPKGFTATYNGPAKARGENTYGGYTSHFVVREEFAITVPNGYDPRYVGPVLCAGITVYSPMKHWGLEAGKTLGVVGVGGLGHMAIKLGKALGARVVALTRSEGKTDEILKMGADEVVISSDKEQMKSARQSLDLMINTIPVPHDINPYVGLMKSDSTIVIVGNLTNFENVVPGPLVFNRIGIAGSLIGGIKETQEVLDLCAEHDITPSIKMVKMQDINDVLSTLEEGNDGDFRHVIDMQSLHEATDHLERTAATIPDPYRGDVVNRRAS
ncbi:alcohol dehydrogenase [Parvularcula bermudensis HTCC2503]|uniref:Alcohol dehydrogenase n=1 Tax=Parvularcula bermudensis (strain ATCC BAA-594 / HTCC2503 / KCTC 12087) TaxID=314260 RepID=E0THU0_PARBH|nr:NAD(P)-dependent alcohol dehydrogenase [Parvularcula bermudensis]ADM10233.1 alcohol dehydrogenase [Parvularcula bermudensis HTCC2503]